MNKSILIVATITVVIVLLIYLTGSWHYLAADKLSPTLLTITVIVYFFSGVVKGVAGIGMGLISVPTMSVVFDPVLAICIIAMPLVITNFWQGVVRASASHTLSQYRTLFLSMTTAMICTGYFASYFSVAITSFVLGTMAVVFSIINLGLRLPRIANAFDFQLQLICGALAGFVGGITGLVVIPLVLYMTCRSIKKDAFVSAIGLLLLISGLVLILCYGLNGAMTSELLFLSTLVSVPALIGVMLGERIRQYLDDQLFRKIVLYMIMAIGAKILVDAST